MRNGSRNPVGDAIRRVGGLTQTALLLRVSGQAVNKWRQAKRMPTDTPEARERVRLLSAKSGVPVLDLVGFTQSNGRGGKRRGTVSDISLDAPATSLADSSSAAGVESIHERAVDAGQRNVTLRRPNRPMSRKVTNGPRVFPVLRQLRQESMPKRVRAGLRQVEQRQDVTHRLVDVRVAPRTTVAA